MLKNVLTIAGSDSCAGAGIQADLKTFMDHKVYGLSVVTAITAQNTKEINRIHSFDGDLVKAQLETILKDIRVDVVKIGMVPTVEIIRVITEKIKKKKLNNIILDPVLVAESGYSLVEKRARKVLIKELLPQSLLITPNLEEAGEILNKKITTVTEMKEAAKEIYQLGVKGVLLKGGHLKGEAIDIFYRGDKIYEFKASRLKFNQVHGTGCTYSAAIAALYANNKDLIEVIKQGKKYISKTILNSQAIGQGARLITHF